MLFRSVSQSRYGNEYQNGNLKDTKLRKFLMEKYNNRCNYCGSIEKLEVELDEFLLSLPEEKGKKADFRWIKRNKHLIKRHIEENGPNFYTLTSLGKRILRLSRINE